MLNENALAAFVTQCLLAGMYCFAKGMCIDCRHAVIPGGGLMYTLRWKTLSPLSNKYKKNI